LSGPPQAGTSQQAEYQYDTQYRGAYNFMTGAIGSSANNIVKSQGFIIGNNVTL
jgi:hypothetical protein